MISKIGYIVFCDLCDAQVEYSEAETEADAEREAEEDGWLTGTDDGEVCPDCQNDEEEE